MAEKEMEKENEQPQSVGIDEEKIKEAEKRVEKDRQIEALVELAKKRGVKHALEVAKRLDDTYVIGRFCQEVDDDIPCPAPPES